MLRGVNLSVPPGTVLALLGSNGAGKTTIVRILSTLLHADGGTATVHGYDVASQAADVRGSISLTGQFAAVNEVLTGRENLVLVARLRRLPDPRGSRTGCSPASTWRTRATGARRRTPEACDVASTSR